MASRGRDAKKKMERAKEEYLKRCSAVRREIFERYVEGPRLACERLALGGDGGLKIGMGGKAKGPVRMRTTK